MTDGLENFLRMLADARSASRFVQRRAIECASRSLDLGLTEDLVGKFLKMPQMMQVRVAPEIEAAADDVGWNACSLERQLDSIGFLVASPLGDSGINRFSIAHAAQHGVEA